MNATAAVAGIYLNNDPIVALQPTVTFDVVKCKQNIGMPAMCDPLILQAPRGER